MRIKLRLPWGELINIQDIIPSMKNPKKAWLGFHLEKKYEDMIGYFQPMMVFTDNHGKEVFRGKVTIFTTSQDLGKPYARYVATDLWYGPENGMIARSYMMDVLNKACNAIKIPTPPPEEPPMSKYKDPYYWKLKKRKDDQKRFLEWVHFKLRPIWQEPYYPLYEYYIFKRPASVAPT